MLATRLAPVFFLLSFAASAPAEKKAEQAPLCYPFPSPKDQDPAPRLPVESIAFAPDGRTLLTTMTTATTVGRWKWIEATGKFEPLTPFSFPVDPATKIPTGSDKLLVITDNGKLAVAGDNDEILTLHNLEGKFAVPTHAFNDLLIEKNNGAPVGAIALQLVVTPDGKRFLSSKANGTIDLWDSTQQAKPLTRFKQPEAAAMAIAPDGKSALVASNPDSQLKFWNLSEAGQAKPRTLFNNVKDGIQELAFSPDGKSAAFRDGKGQVRLWKMNAPEKAETLVWSTADKSQPAPAPFGLVNRVGQGRLAFSPDGARLATIDPEGHAVLWDLKTKKMTRLEPLSVLAQSLAFSPKGDTLAVGVVDGFCLHGLNGPLTVPKEARPERHLPTGEEKSHGSVEIPSPSH